jgi:hypothetical protein
MTGGTGDRGDEQGFFDSWVTCDERNAHHCTYIGIGVFRTTLQVINILSHELKRKPRPRWIDRGFP